jgi:hypothetical protein
MVVFSPMDKQEQEKPTQFWEIRTATLKTQTEVCFLDVWNLYLTQ